MKRKVLILLGMALSMAFVLTAIQPAFGAERTVVLRISGCGWPSDEGQVRIIGRQIEGVTKTDANFIKGTATLTFDETKTDIDKIKEAFRRAGYPVMGSPRWID